MNALCRRFWRQGLWGAWLWIVTGHSPLDAASLYPPVNPVESQITHGPGGRILTNTGVWSPDGDWIVYDTRSDPAGAVFDGETIEMVNIHTGEVQVLYRATRGAHCGVATFHPREPRVVFILGPEDPTPDWSYAAWHRRGVIVEGALQDGKADRVQNLDARDLTPPFTPGALRGGTHLHVWEPAGEWICFTYEDHLLAQFSQPAADHDMNRRNVGICVPSSPVRVKPDHPRNHGGTHFSALVTRTTAAPRPGSDEISRACEEAWVGTRGYVRPDNRRQVHALAFQGQVVTASGDTISEVFVVDVPELITMPGAAPLAGTAKRSPRPPQGTRQRRLTQTADRRYPGVQGPRHWLRSSPDGSQIAFLMKDDSGVVQLWTVSPNGGVPRQITHNPWPIASAFTWSRDGRFVAHAMDRSVCVTEVASGRTRRLTARADEANAPRPEACVFSPDGTRIAYVRRMSSPQTLCNQVFVLRLPGERGGG